MSLLVDTNFADFSAWDQTFGSNRLVSGIGCGGGAAWTCSTGSVRKSVGNLTAVTVRQSFAVYSTYTALLSDYPFRLISWGGTTPPAAVPTQSIFTGFSLYMNGAGGMRMVSSTGPFALPTTSGGAYILGVAADGTLPTDGTVHALEVALSFPDHHTVAWNVVLDGASVFSGTASPTEALQYGYCTLLHVGPPNPGGCDTWVEAAYIDTIDVFAWTGAVGTAHPACISTFTTLSAHCEIEATTSVGAYTACAGVATVTDGTCCVSSTPPVDPPGGGGDGGVPVAPPKIPLVKCAPQSIISSPAPNAGCSKGGTGWRRTYNGPSGTVPIGADPVDGETMTGKTAAHLWIEIRHTNY